jgi:hypothetical protein
MFQMFHVSFLYVASVVSGCFKSGSGVAHGMRVKSGRGASGLRARPCVGTGDVGVVERCPGGAGPRVDARNEGETDGSRASGCGSSSRRSDASRAPYSLFSKIKWKKSNGPPTMGWSSLPPQL